MNVMDKQNEEQILEKSCQTERPKEEFQNKFDSAFTTLENKIHDTKISASEEDVILNSKAKKTEGRNREPRLFTPLILFHLPNLLKMSWICIRELVLK
ncbi:hypothetical protein GLOIN_2v1836991 [Rhizophagus clarus]|uniref:Uncharacterized protein n=1 Tax=Rhizophagus clarus TaxID=94130 RepID=A0A8H3LB54_9GLOM|nr:hypothetical protein GLOIN_2v1836991 [Rhizophagus clarus]